MVSTTRRGVSAFSAAAITALFALSPTTPVYAESVATADPAEAAAGWLVDALVDDERIQSVFDGEAFDAPGATADAVVALASVGVAADTITTATDWLETQSATYAGANDDVTVGAIGKLLIVAATTDRDPNDFGGVDLVTKVQAAEVTDPDAADSADLPGRFRDVGEFGDFSSPLSQALVLLGLQRTEAVTPSPEAVQVLLDQQCDDGGFAGSFLVPTTEDPSPACEGSVDTTGYAVQALDALGEDAAVDAAVAWLTEVQADDGSFGSADGDNTNSTGLAAVAMSVGDGDASAIDAARAFITGLQDGCGDVSPGAIPFSADERGFVELATAQALPGLVGVGLAEVSASGAEAVVPVLDCPTDTAPVDEEDEDGQAAVDDGQHQDGTGAERGAEQDIEQPLRVDSGISPSADPFGASVVAWLMVLGAALIGTAVAGTAAVAHRRGRV